MKIDIITLFPDMFKGPFDESIIKRAQSRELVEINIHQLRNWTEDKHKTVDDHPFGGGVGMLLKVEPIYKAVTELKQKKNPPVGGHEPASPAKRGEQKVILLDAGGKKYTQAKAQELSEVDHLIIIAGRYEGVDHRIREHLIDEEISIGEYVLTGGELPAMVIIDSIVRLIPGVLEKAEATELESHSKEGIVEYPQYTRPETFNNWKVPEILLSGNHKKITDWKKEEAEKRSHNR